MDSKGFKTLMSNDLVEIEYNNQIKTYSVSWKKNIDSHKYRFTYLKAVVLLNKYRASSFILDVRPQRIFGSTHQKWFEKNILDKWKQLEIGSACIVVQLNNARKKYYSRTIIDKAKNINFPIKIVNTYEEAITWCEEREFDLVNT